MPTEQGCDLCIGWWKGLNRPSEPLRAIGVSGGASVFQCRNCDNYWGEASGSYPHIYPAARVRAEYAELFDRLERPDDGSSWVAD